MHVESGHVSALQRVCQRFPPETAHAVFDLWIGNDDRPGNLKAELSEDSFGAIFAMDQEPRCSVARTGVPGTGTIA